MGRRFRERQRKLGASYDPSSAGCFLTKSRGHSNFQERGQTRGRQAIVGGPYISRPKQILYRFLFRH